MVWRVNAGNSVGSELALLSGQAIEGVDLEAVLPPGRLIKADEGEGEVSLWLSSTAPAVELWTALYRLRGRTGLWPLLLAPLAHGKEFRPWASGELFPEQFTSPEDHDPNDVLEAWWQAYAETDQDDQELPGGERGAVTAPYGRRWPGLAPNTTSQGEPGSFAIGYAQQLTGRLSSLRLGLAAARRGSDALVSVGWSGPLNHTNDTAEIASVVRGWEDRFGVRVVGVGFADLYLSVSAPPSTHQEALRIAAEHFAFCPDNIQQNNGPAILASYAERLIGLNAWHFWWD
ncbi:DUF4253 domain-containing protein [Actinomadura litoris]|uniref:DUF4253 domain-containing protein n=1 Tax=Actinomadura litoris TaxID=2678616 RepID=A0A7K1L548_9ACTN|nr:DUF4253 domain-containing protein [Actinomadura litoris]MUN39547.1 DUF4253 domain-containing protein [Actinomadura litoris]